MQLTPQGSACSIAFGEGISEMVPGTLNAIQVVIDSAADAHRHLTENGVAATEPDVQPWGTFVTFADPDGNRWILQQMPVR